MANREWQVPPWAKPNEYGICARVNAVGDGVEVAYGETDDHGRPRAAKFDAVEFKALTLEWLLSVYWLDDETDEED